MNPMRNGGRITHKSYLLYLCINSSASVSAKRAAIRALISSSLQRDCALRGATRPFPATSLAFNYIIFKFLSKVRSHSESILSRVTKQLQVSFSKWLVSAEKYPRNMHSFKQF